MKQDWNWTSARSLIALVCLFCIATLVSTSLTQARSIPSDPGVAMETLLSSLDAEQQQALQAALAQYEDDLAALATQLGPIMLRFGSNEQIFVPLVNAGAADAVVRGDRQAYSEQTTLPDAAALQAIVATVTPDLVAIQSTFEQTLASILTAEQAALYQAALTAPTTLAVAPSNAEVQQGDLDPVLCFNAAQWANYGAAYVTSAKAFAIMAAFNVDFGTRTPEARQSYVTYNEAEAYALNGLQGLSTASVAMTAADIQVQNINGGTFFGVTGTNNVNAARISNALAVGFALTDYANSGGIIVNGVGIGGNYFAYFAASYGVIADIYLNGSQVRTPACY